HGRRDGDGGPKGKRTFAGRMCQTQRLPPVLTGAASIADWCADIGATAPALTPREAPSDTLHGSGTCQALTSHVRTCPHYGWWSTPDKCRLGCRPTTYGCAGWAIAPSPCRRHREC